MANNTYTEECVASSRKSATAHLKIHRSLRISLKYIDHEVSQIFFHIQHACIAGSLFYLLLPSSLFIQYTGAAVINYLYYILL